MSIKYTTTTSVPASQNLSANAGVLRLLVPPEAQTLLAEMRTGKRATIEPSLHQAWLIYVVFEDGSASPFSVAISPAQMDRKLTTGKCQLAVWTRRGREMLLPCEIRIQ